MLIRQKKEVENLLDEQKKIWEEKEADWEVKEKDLDYYIDYKGMLEQKTKDQDTALINLARQKIKGKKEAEKLLTELETKWSKKEIDWEKLQEEQAQALAQEKENSMLEINELKSKIKERDLTIEHTNVNYTKLFQKHKKELENIDSLNERLKSSKNEVDILQERVKDKEQTIKNLFNKLDNFIKNN